MDREDVIKLMRRDFISIQNTLEVVEDLDWHGKWRIKRVMELCRRNTALQGTGGEE